MGLTNNTRYHLFLDDIRVPSTAYQYMKLSVYNLLDWVIVRSYKEFVKVIEEHGIPETVSYDHDLADDHYDPSTWRENFVYQEKTGYDCAKYLIDKLNGIEHPTWYVHSWNPIGARKIKNLIEDYEKNRGN